MLTIGLTGQSGAGKGEFCKIFTQHDGVLWLDTDKTARQVVEKGKPCLDALVDYFTKDILLPDGTLDRKKLASIAFSDKEKHNKLNEITHFYITKEVKEWLDNARKSNALVAIIDAPLLFESGCDSLCDITIGVIAPYCNRLSRVMERDGIDEKNARTRLDSQPDDCFFKDKCTYIIENTSDLNALKSNSEQLIKHILEKFSPKGEL